MQFLENRIRPPFVALIAIALEVLASYLMPLAGFDFSYNWLVGIVIALAGFCCAFAGLRAFSRAGTTHDPVNIEAASSLVTTGIYRYTRNPMYVGLTLLVTGIAIGLGALSALIVVAGMVFYINRFQIIPEERVMHQLFGEEFEKYSAAVRRWI